LGFDEHGNFLISTLVASPRKFLQRIVTVLSAQEPQNTLEGQSATAFPAYRAGRVETVMQGEPLKQKKGGPPIRCARPVWLEAD
jgi:hypothetical protein